MKCLFEIKKLILSVLLGVIISFIFCSCEERTTKLYDEGVSKELAQWRKESISELKYDLQFTLPREKADSVAGNVIVDFKLQTSDEVILDFRQSADKIKYVKVNGQCADYNFSNEHIILSDKYFKAGDNSVEISFVAGDQSLNRNDEYLYTLLVPDRARTLFPCFDQPNLKAEYSLSLKLPKEWVAVANSPVKSEIINNDNKIVEFKPTEPLSTYLFSFVAGKFEKVEYNDEGRRLVAYHRETDPKRLAQFDEIFHQIVVSLDWLEDYTSIDYPFAKYDFVILPGFQYGGMEHTGATLYNDTRIFLSENPTPDEELKRVQLIAHETAHMWFGDYVTMDWFDDVWTKEVFANYFAARITEPLYPDINHRLNWLKMTATPSLSEDRTIGTTSIKQSLDNLKDAGLVYGNIIYCKSPIVLEKMIEIMGEKAFQEGVREYLKTYAYGNATWEDLIDILDEKTDFDLKRFSQVWINEKGMPHIEFEIKGEDLLVTQADIFERGLLWPQKFNVIVVADSLKTIEVNMDRQSVAIPIQSNVKAILPNSDGRGYGHFIVDDKSRRWIKDNWAELSDETLRQSLLMSLNENYWNGMISDDEWLNFLIDGLQSEKNSLVASSFCSCMAEPMKYQSSENVENKLFEMSENHAIQSCRLLLLRILMSNFRSQVSYQRFYDMWHNMTNELLSETDYMTLAYELSVRNADNYDYIISMQIDRIKNPDRLRQFDFIASSVHPDNSKRDEFFNSLLEPENRSIEPWTARALSYLNHACYQPNSLKYIRIGLEELREVQKTGDIFFPRDWVGALLSNYTSKEASAEVEKFLKENPHYPQLLKNKILQAVSPTYRNPQ